MRPPSVIYDEIRPTLRETQEEQGGGTSITIEENTAYSRININININNVWCIITNLYNLSLLVVCENAFYLTFKKYI